MGLSIKSSDRLRYNLSQKQAKRITKMYSDLVKDLDKEISRLNLKQVSGQMQKSYLEGLKKDLCQEVINIHKKLEVDIPANMKDMADSIVKDNEKFFAQLGVDISGKLSHVPTDVVTNILTGSVYSGDWSFSKAIWGDSKKQIDDINSIVAKGVAMNKPAYDIAKDLEKYVDPKAKKPWDWGKVYPGTSKKVDYNAQRLARTLVSHAYQQSLIATTKNNPFVTGIRWRSAHTHRTCELCNERDGTLYKPEDLPLDHPNGMCTYIAETPSLTKIADDLADWVEGKPNPALDKWATSLGYDITKGEKPQPSTISSVDQIKTLEDARQYCIDNQLFRTLWSKTGPIDQNAQVDFKGIPIESAKAILKGYERVYEKYPFLRGRSSPLELIKLSPGVTAETSFGRGQSASGISFSLEDYGNYNSYVESLKRQVLSKWLSAGSEIPESTTIHEFGHRIESIYMSAKGQSTAPSGALRNRIMKSFGGTSFHQVVDSLSEYATKNSSEWFAEAFAEYMCSDNPRPVAQQVGEYIDSKMMPVIQKYFEEQDAFLEYELKKRGLK